MGKSNEIDLIATALAKFQGQCPAVKKSGRNSHLNSAYVTLDDIITSIRKPLADNGLAWTQLLHGKNGSVKLTTLLMHESGQWIDGTVIVEAGAKNRGINEIQALGSSITYMKRYALSAMLGIAAETDDDGNGASQKKGQPATAKKDQGPKWKPANGKSKEEPADNADGFDSPRELLLAIQKKTDHYKSLPHMLNALKKIEGDEYSWPQAGDVGGYEVALALLLDHAEASKITD